MQAELIALSDLVASDLAAWRALATRALESNPFFEPQMVTAAARHVADGIVLGLLVVRDRSELRACVPVQSVRRGHRFPFPMLTVWRHDYSFLGTPLVDRDCAEAAVHALREPLGHRGVPHFLFLHQVGDEVTALLQESRSSAQALEVADRAVAVGRDGGPPPLGLSGKARRELARKGRALATGDDGEMVHGVPLSSEVVEQFLALEASGWKGRAGTALASRCGHSDFFRELCTSPGADGRVRFVAVGDPAEPAAMSCFLMGGEQPDETAFAFKLAVDERRNAQSPGVQLMADVPRFLLTDGTCSLVDSCSDPEDETVNRLWTERRRLTSLLVSDGVVGRSVGRVAGGLSRLRRRDRTAV